MSTRTKQRPKQRAKQPDITKLSKPDARVAIARDVLSQLKAKKFKAKHRTYCDFKPKTGVKRSEFFTEADIEAGKDVQDILKLRMDSCQVCAKGALFVSAVRKFDNLPVGDDMLGSTGGWHGDVLASSTFKDSDSDFINHLYDYFDHDQLELIERAFEGDVGDVTEDEEEAALVFFKQNKNAEQRMTAIMKNIIKNKGEFVLPPLPEDDD